jgi:tRNA acetyltransferase TAN1
MSVVGSDYDELKRFNLSEIYNPTSKPSERNPAKASEQNPANPEEQNPANPEDKNPAKASEQSPES